MSKFKSYKNCSVEDLLNRQDFITEVKKQDAAGWKKILELNPENKQNLIEAKSLIGYFDINEELLDNERKDKLWKEIADNKNRINKWKLKKVISFFPKRITAAAVLFIGLLVGWYTITNQKDKWIFDNPHGLATQRTTLLLSDGKKVALGKERSEVKVLNGKNALQINNDSIISVKRANSPSTSVDQFNTIIVPFGESTNLQLADGTKVWLNAGSQLAFPTSFSGDNRKVYLEGEGYFEVAKNQHKSFIVCTNKLNIIVYGTKFNLSAYSNDGFIETMLLEGSVSVKENQSLFKTETKLIPGQKAIYNKDSKKINLDMPENPEYTISWLEGWHHFSNVDILQVLRKLERFYNVQFKYDNELIKSSSNISGKLDLKKSVNEVVSVLCKVAEIDYHIEENTIFLTKKN